MDLNILDLFKTILEDKKNPAQMLLLVIEALTAMCAALSANPEHLGKFVDELYSIGLADMLSDLQLHKNDDVYEKARNLIFKYFEVETNI